MIALIPLVFALARKHLPARPDQPVRIHQRHQSISELNRRFTYTQWWVGFAMVGVDCAIALGAYWILLRLNHFLADLDGPFDLALLPQKAIWWFFPVFAALSLCWESTLAIWRFVSNKDTVALYNYWTITKAGFDSTRILRWMALLIVLPIGILTVPELPSHSVLKADRIMERDYGFSGPHVYLYRNARRLTVIKGFRERYGKLVNRAGVVLDFVDGQRWSSVYYGDWKSTVDSTVVSYLQQKTGLIPEYRDTEAEIVE